MPELSVIVPFYNEEKTIARVIQAIKSAGIKSYELILVDDGSSDRSLKLAEAASETGDIILAHTKNQGKSAAMRTALEKATGKWIIVQDADLEYAPIQIPHLMSVARNENVVVFGLRPGFWSWPNRWMFATGVLFIDLLILFTYRHWVRDHATCYKLIPRDLYKRMRFASTGFEGCIELTAKLMRLGVPIKQVKISYHPRTASEGKKLRAIYVLAAVRTVLRYRNWS